MKKICFIAPYAALADMAAEAVREKGLDNIAVHQCPIQESVAFARSAQQKGAQILISRGGAATGAAAIRPSRRTAAAAARC